MSIYKKLRDDELSRAQELFDLLSSVNNVDDIDEMKDIINAFIEKSFALMTKHYGSLNVKKFNMTVSKKTTAYNQFKKELSSKLKEEDSVKLLIDGEFCSEKDLKERKDGSGQYVPPGILSKYISAKWKELDEDGKKPYEELAKNFNKKSLDLWYRENIMGEDVSKEKAKLEGKEKKKSKAKAEIEDSDEEEVKTLSKGQVKKLLKKMLKNSEGVEFQGKIYSIEKQGKDYILNLEDEDEDESVTDYETIGSILQSGTKVEFGEEEEEEEDEGKME
jgi:hypothetical protein